MSLNLKKYISNIKNIINIDVKPKSIKNILFYITLLVLILLILYCVVKYIKTKEFFENEKIIIPDIIGGLGNQLFVVASAYSYSKDNNYKLMLDNRGDVFSYGKPRPTYNNTIFQKISVTDIDKKDFKNLTENEFSKGITDNTKNIYLTSGYYQEARYFNKYRNELLDLLEPNTDILKKVNDILKNNSIDTNNDFLVSIHIRLDDDYTPIDQDKRVYDQDEYNTIINKLPEHINNHPNTKFIIFSNDIARTKDIFKNSKIDDSRMKYVQSEDYVELALMSKCNDYIASPSTFNWWGIYLNRNPEKKVFTYWKQDTDYRKDFYKKYEYFKDNNIIKGFSNYNSNVSDLNIINGFHLTDYKYLFFDIFYKDNKIYMILPIYDNPVNSNDIQLIINNNKIDKTKEYLKDSYEPTQILIYDYTTKLEYIDLMVKYKDKINNYKLQNIDSNKYKNELSLTTLFKDDYNIFPLFYKYYKNQGVNHFYMYYNGKITPEIRNVLNLDNVTLIEWDYQYFNNDCKYLHHAQMGQMHHAIYKYGKDMSKYMIFCDLDEYLYIPNNTISKNIMSNNDVDVFGFCNKYSKTLDEKIPINFPNKFVTSKPIAYGDRSKNIYKLSSINTIGIHSCNDYTIEIPNIKSNFDMFHFYKWTNKNRDSNTDLNNCNILTILDNDNLLT